jgi:FecR protein
MKTTQMMKIHRLAGLVPASNLSIGFWGLMALLLSIVPAGLRAQDAGQPARAIRLSYVDGKVHLAQGNQSITDQAVVNTPLVEGMSLTTADDGRAEIQFEDGSVARLSPDSALTIKTLRGQGTGSDAELDVDGGLAYFELQGNGQAGQIRVRFGDSVVTGSGFTVFRVKNDTPPGEVAVFSGNAHLEGSNGLALDVHGGESVALNNTDPNGYNLAESIEPDSWDSWNSDRDQALSSEAAAQTNAPADLSQGQSANPAWSDLDANGQWYNVPGQGYVWSPYDASNAGFDPYGNGNWVWTPGFGYTWASAYPWGYMPYQCGAWNFYNGFGWGWAPGFGGCSPWWSTGFYGGPVFGVLPVWYHPIHRPIGPRVPIPHRPMPMIAVNRRPQVFAGGLPARDLNTPVRIGGQTVAALRPVPGRSTYESSSFMGRAVYGQPTVRQETPAGGARPGFVPTRPAYAAPHPGNTYAPQHGNYEPPASRPNSAPAPRPAPAYHPPSGGGGGYHPPSGGGGGSHPSGGGGGGGGHPSGGGGGGRR